MHESEKREHAHDGSKRARRTRAGTTRSCGWRGPHALADGRNMHARQPRAAAPRGAGEGCGRAAARADPLAHGSLAILPLPSRRPSSSPARAARRARALMMGGASPKSDQGTRPHLGRGDHRPLDVVGTRAGVEPSLGLAGLHTLLIHRGTLGCGQTQVVGVGHGQRAAERNTHAKGSSRGGTANVRGWTAATGRRHRPSPGARASGAPAALVQRPAYVFREPKSVPGEAWSPLLAVCAKLIETGMAHERSAEGQRTGRRSATSPRRVVRHAGGGGAMADSERAKGTSFLPHSKRRLSQDRFGPRRWDKGGGFGKGPKKMFDEGKFGGARGGLRAKRGCARDCASTARKHASRRSPPHRRATSPPTQAPAGGRTDRQRGRTAGGAAAVSSKKPEHRRAARQGAGASRGEGLRRSDYFGAVHIDNAAC